MAWCPPERIPTACVLLSAFRTWQVAQAAAAYRGYLREGYREQVHDATAARAHADPAVQAALYKSSAAQLGPQRWHREAPPSVYSESQAALAQRGPTFTNNFAPPVGTARYMNF